MGCDIHPFVEVKMSDGTWVDMKAPKGLYDRNYFRFAFLTGGVVRNYSGAPGWLLPEPRGYPKDSSKYCQEQERCMAEGYGEHSASYLTLEELTAIDYNMELLDAPGEGVETLGQALGEGWFDILRELAIMGHGPASDVRIVFNFDN